jgi:hypothetical protein
MPQDSTGGHAGCERAARYLANLCYAHDLRAGNGRKFLKDLTAVLAYACDDPRVRREDVGTPLVRAFYREQLLPMVERLAEDPATRKVLLGKVFLLISGAVVPRDPDRIPEINNKALGTLFALAASSHR